MRIAYADPPYIGKAAKFYKEHPDYAGEVDHKDLVTRLVSEYQDGWALSCSSSTLKEILGLCPESVRVAVWVKNNPTIKKGVNPIYAWEPVIFSGGRKPKDWIRDWCLCPSTMFMKSPFVGSKPEIFCYWIFDLLGLNPTDELIDLFPGTGAVTTAWQSWKSQGRLMWTPQAPSPINQAECNFDEEYA